MEENKNVCNTLPDSDKCYDTEHHVSDYGKSYKEQVEESKLPSQEEFSNELYGDKRESDYVPKPILENPMDKAGQVNDFQAGAARNEESLDYINQLANEQGYKDVVEEIEAELEQAKDNE